MFAIGYRQIIIHHFVTDRKSTIILNDVHYVGMSKVITLLSYTRTTNVWAKKLVARYRGIAHAGDISVEVLTETIRYK